MTAAMHQERSVHTLLPQLVMAKRVRQRTETKNKSPDQPFFVQNLRNPRNACKHQQKWDELCAVATPKERIGVECNEVSAQPKSNRRNQL